MGLALSPGSAPAQVTEAASTKAKGSPKVVATVRGSLFKEKYLKFQRNRLNAGARGTSQDFEAGAEDFVPHSNQN